MCAMRYNKIIKHFAGKQELTQLAKEFKIYVTIVAGTSLTFPTNVAAHHPTCTP